MKSTYVAVLYFSVTSGSILSCSDNSDISSHGQQFIKWTKYWVYRKAYVLHTAQVITICDKFVVCLFDGV
jgi:hypothetical protein